MISKEQEWMIAYLPEIVQYCESFWSLEVPFQIVLGSNQVLLVYVELSMCKVAKDNELITIWQLTLELQLLLGSSQDVSLNDISQFMQTFLRCLLLYLGSISVTPLNDSFAEGVLKVLKLTKETRLNKVKQTPEF